MRDLTTNWNNAAYNDETVFVDIASGLTMTIGANNPVNVRSMFDSVQAGTYFVNPTSIAVSDETLASDVSDEDEVTVTLTPVTGFVRVTASTDDGTVATVSPAVVRTLVDGTAKFTITSVGAGVATITFTCGTRTATTVVTVTDPEA